MRPPPRALDPRRPRIFPGLARWLDAALAEDRVRDDPSTRSVLPGPRRGSARVVVQAPGVVSGIVVATVLARRAGLRVRVHVRDGSRVRRGQTVLDLSGDLRRILAIERTLLNLLLHLSGIATATALAVRRARTRTGGPRVFATRKTLPGLRDLEKQAVRDGGGWPHRRDLSGGVLLKRTHLRLLAIEPAVRAARARAGPRGFVQVEVTGPGGAIRAARAGADAVLVDNASPARARQVVRALDRARLRRHVWVELSGGITPRNVARYVRTGADAVSLGALTHSAPALPFHLVLRS